ncbi:ribosome recycling factor [Paraclostridium ghonii]|uniref:ribosome recycling factor n=1 Tax=Paraclostridium ghonii TaxID=29358 RepID=UPI00202CEA2B|nr:ribosome recycling factor [Paeniclostridium ghonii]MCM0165982.1 ribosome recycling factor [Paeniclostridium ghonii]
MSAQVKKQLEEKMNKTIEALKSEFTTIRAGRANAQMLDKIRVDYYGTPTPINQVGAISVPEPRTLMINPWDKTAMGEIEKAIRNSDLGLNPTNDGQIIRISVPALTEERRKELAKQAGKVSEEFKVRLRNERRDANDKLKKMEKEGEITEDDLKKSQDEVQKLTDKFVKEVDSLLKAKEQDIMAV